MSAADVEELTLVDDDGMRLSLSASWLGRTTEIPKLVFAIGEGPHSSFSIDLAAITASEILSWLTDGSAASSLTLKNAIGDRLELYLARDELPSATMMFRITTWSDITREFHAPIALAIDLAKFGAMLVNPSSPPPAFILRVRKANTLLGFGGSVEDCVTEVLDMADDEIAKLLMGLAARGRVDLAVSLLERLSQMGRMKDTDSEAAWSHYDSERPEDVTWPDLLRWAGATLQLENPEFVERQKHPENSTGYQPYDYVDCFERAFEMSFDKIPFDSMDFKDVQARLRRLAEYIDAYYDGVAYPPAESGQVIPYIVGREQWTEGLGFDYTQFRYAPPIWYEEARRELLFAHKICFEDPLCQIIGPVVAGINARNYYHDGRRVEPSKVHPSLVELLRRTLINAQKMGALIRRGIVIPHSLLTNRIEDYSEGEYSTIRFRDENSYFLAEDLANTLGPLISTGLADGLGLPAYIVEKAKELATGPGECEDIGWFQEFFDEISIHNRDLPSDDPIRLWPDHMYQIALRRRYVDVSGLGYAPHFLHKDGYQLYALLEAAHFATSEHSRDVSGLSLDEDEESKYVETMRSDAIVLSRIDSFLRPKLDVLSDQDLVSIRMEEQLFKDWRAVVGDSLKAVREYESLTGRSHPEIAIKEVRERFEKWRADSPDQLRRSILGQMFDVGEGVAVSVVGGAVLGGLPSVASISLGALYTALKSVHRTFTWRSKQKLYNRHFLSIT